MMHITKQRNTPRLATLDFRRWLNRDDNTKYWYISSRHRGYREISWCWHCHRRSYRAAAFRSTLPRMLFCLYASLYFFVY